MKKLTAFLVGIVMAFSVVALSGCDNTAKIVIGAPEGAPAAVIYSMLKEVTEIDGKKVEYKIVSGADEISRLMAVGEIDAAVMPLNLAARLYNQGTDLKLMSVNIFGNLFLLGNTPISSLSDCLNKTICCIGENGTPGITLKYLLQSTSTEWETTTTEAGGKVAPITDKVAVHFVADGPTAIKLLKLGYVDYIVLGEPAVSAAIKNTNASVVMNFQQEWEKINGANSYLQAGFVVNKDIYISKKTVAALYSELEKGVTALSENLADIDDVLIANGYSSAPEFDQELLSRCNIKCLKATGLKAELNSYFNILKGFNNALIGGDLPNDDFYLEVE